MIDQAEKPGTLPRWLAAVIGVLLLPVILIIIVGTGVIVFDPQVDNPALTYGIGGVMLLAALWLLKVSIRMIFNLKQTAGGLISPIVLRVVSYVFLVIPIASMALGTFWEKPIIHSIMTAAYISIFFGLNRLATQRSMSVQNGDT